VLLGAVAFWALAGMAPAGADTLQLAQVACSDGTQFNVSLDTDSLNQLSDVINDIDLQDLAGWTCTLTVLGPILSPTVSLASRLPLGADSIVLLDSSTTAKQFSAGGGQTDSFHFAYAAHQDPDGTYGGYSVLNLADGSQIKGHVTCVFVPPQSRATVFTFRVDSFSGTGTDLTGDFVHMEAVDNGSPSQAPPSDTIDMVNVDGLSGCGSSGTAQNVTSGNLVVRAS
jgi:hypothetical protein